MTRQITLIEAGLCICIARKRGEELEVNRLYTGDCRELFKQMPDDYVDIVVTSPPYNQLGRSRAKAHGWSSVAGMYKTNKWYRNVTESEMYDDEMEEGEYQAWLRDVISECLRVARGLVWVNHKTRYRNKVGIHPLQFLDFPFYAEVIWARNGSMALNCKRFAPSHEFIYAFGERHYWDDAFNTLCSVWNIPSSRNDGHPCSFPVEIPKRLIVASCPPNGIVLDPMCGSGTTAVAALNLNRRYIGIELNPDYIEIAEKRIREEASNLVLPL